MWRGEHDYGAGCVGRADNGHGGGCGCDYSHDYARRFATTYYGHSYYTRGHAYYGCYHDGYNNDHCYCTYDRYYDAYYHCYCNDYNDYCTHDNYYSH